MKKRQFEQAEFSSTEKKSLWAIICDGLNQSGALKGARFLKKHPHRWIIGAGIGIFLLLLLIAIVTVVHQHHQRQHEATVKSSSKRVVTTPAPAKLTATTAQPALSQLHDITLQLAHIEQLLTTSTAGAGANTKAGSVALSPHALSQLEHNLSQQMQQALAPIQAELTAQHRTLLALQQQLKTAHQQPKALPVVSASTLPFTLLSLDNIEQHTLATIRYDNQTTAIGVGEAVAGWKLVEADTTNQTAIFASQKGKVVVNLNTFTHQEAGHA